MYKYMPNELNIKGDMLFLLGLHSCFGGEQVSLAIAKFDKK